MLKCTKFKIGRGSIPDPTGGAYNAPPDLLAGFKVPNSKRQRKGEKRRWGWQGTWRKGEGERKGKGMQGTGKWRMGTSKGWLTPRYVRNPKNTPVLESIEFDHLSVICSPRHNKLQKHADVSVRSKL